MPESLVTPDPAGLLRARLVAQWHLGDAGYGEMFVRAYLDENDPEWLEAEAELSGDDDG